LTFFSPSGYEVEKNNAVADVTVYLPMDTKNAQQFLDLIHPDGVFYQVRILAELLKRTQKRDIKPI
jgi:3-deoxy-D-manno-octulosonic-acid transferase